MDTLTFGIPITKSASTADGVFVEGIATSDDLDLDGQIIDKGFAVRGLRAWFDDWGNVRQMHSPSLAPAGKAVSMEVRDEGIWVRTHVVEPTAVQLVKAGVYSAYSVGISQPRIISDGIAKNGRVVDGVFSELSLVDFPANPNSRFTLAKRAGNGRIETIGKSFDAAGATADLVRDLSTDIRDLVRRAKMSDHAISEHAFTSLIRLVGPSAAARLLS
ncbi:hypothetical protein SCMU_18370 [Sinomonas cyclohexanicum]|uniref:HK97 family phage prohead protease n=1 Tax=Sinomonas cyclohexanicum TaxID=322009 RepID=A0ABM7PV13_SINCY|nr:hypothetical protein [Corynebacterium cyclohexanicum]BCT75995.1 hypothetical protein SCMU_18370 [Corynebacterium cyclohexanicum]